MDEVTRTDGNQSETGYILRLKDDGLSCLWKGSCEPTPSTVRSLITRWEDRMPNAMGSILLGVVKPQSEGMIQLLKLVAFIRWCESETRRIAAIKEQEEQQKASRDFEKWCSVFDQLPRTIKAKAIDFAGRRNPFNPANYPDPGVPVVLPDRDRPGFWRAHRAGNLGMVGYGKTQIEALDVFGGLPQDLLYCE